MAQGSRCPRLNQHVMGPRWGQLSKHIFGVSQCFSLCALDGPSSVQAKGFGPVVTKTHIQKQAEPRERSEISGGL